MTARTDPRGIDKYAAGFAPEIRTMLQELHDIIRQAAPEARLATRYGMPAFLENGTYVAYFAGYKAHVSLYPVPKSPPALEAAMQPYKSGAGTLRFPAGKPLPRALIVRVVKEQVKQSRLRAKKRGSQS